MINSINFISQTEASLVNNGNYGGRESPFDASLSLELFIAQRKEVYKSDSIETEGDGEGDYFVSDWSNCCTDWLSKRIFIGHRIGQRPDSDFFKCAPISEIDWYENFL